MDSPITGRLFAFMRNKDGKLSFKFGALIGIFAVALCVFIAVVLVFPGQNERRAKLDKEHADKQQQLDELILQKEFLQELSSISENREYLIRYLRETQGYILKGDIRVDLADTGAPLPSPVYDAD